MISEEGSAMPVVKVAKPKRVVMNPQPKLNLESLQGPKGLLALNDLFKDFKFKGSGHEKEDLRNILKLLEQWSYRLFPKLHFQDNIKKLENLGKKREIQVYLRKIRTGMLDNDVVRQVDDDEDVEPVSEGLEPPQDSFDQLLSQQIASTQVAPSLTDEQIARMERNRKLAMERRLQKLATRENGSLAMELDSQDAV